MKIGFVITSSGISGGHNIIFEHAFNLQERGHQVELLVDHTDQFKFAYQWHDRTSFLNFRSIEDIRDKHSYDIAIATNYHSVFHLPRIIAKQYSFFMQAKESDFIHNDDIPHKKWILSVLDFKLPAIVSATWMAEYLSKYHDQEAFVCLSGIRKDLFNLDGIKTKPILDKDLRVLVEGPLNVPHKNVESTLELCLASEAKEVWLLTSSSNSKNIPPGVRIFSAINIQDLGKIYRSCDVLVKLSTSEGMFGPPLEIFHCGGTAITYNVSGHEEYLVDGVNSLVIPMGDENLALKAINSLSEDTLLLNRLKGGAKKTAEEWPDWEASSIRFEEGLIWASNNTQITRDALFQAIQASTKTYLRRKWRIKKGGI